LNAAEKRLNPDGKGESLHADGVDEIKRLASPEVAYYLALPENHAAAHALLGLRGERLRDKIRRIEAKVKAARPFVTRRSCFRIPMRSCGNGARTFAAGSEGVSGQNDYSSGGHRLSQGWRRAILQRDRNRAGTSYAYTIKDGPDVNGNYQRYLVRLPFL